jgi:hypothetical protein
MERQLIHSTRLDKLEDLVEEVRRHGGLRFYTDEHDLMAHATADAMLALIELEKLAGSLLNDVAAQHKVAYES